MQQIIQQILNHAGNFKQKKNVQQMVQNVLM